MPQTNRGHTAPAPKAPRQPWLHDGARRLMPARIMAPPVMAAL